MIVFNVFFNPTLIKISVDRTKRHSCLICTIGYVMTAATWGGLSDFWFSVFLGWLIKLIILKIFGLKAHQRAIPFFLGLVMGDYIFISMWALVGTLFNISTYVLWSP
ncbi:MAG: DUF6784 domain-containing protein [Candidatus Poribacteria bacterium]|nr:DUF6784 domain-containing protein [Candidatus Poribacteria bacterium]